MKSFLELVKEEKQGEVHHAMTFGRMNPPTTGHLKVIEKVREIADKHNAGHTVVTSHSQDSKKNPLSAAQKIKHLKCRTSLQVQLPEYYMSEKALWRIEFRN